MSVRATLAEPAKATKPQNFGEYAGSAQFSGRNRARILARPVKKLPLPVNRTPRPLYLRFRGAFAGRNPIPRRRRATQFSTPLLHISRRRRPLFASSRHVGPHVELRTRLW